MATPFPTPAPGDVWGQQLIDIITEHKAAAVAEALTEVVDPASETGAALTATIASEVAAPLATKASKSNSGYDEFQAVDAEALRPWWSALAGREYEAADVVFIGDSFTEMVGANVHGRQFVSKFRDRIRQKFPVAGVAGGYNYIPSYFSNAYPGSPVTTTGSPGLDNSLGWSFKNVILSAGKSVTFTTNLTSGRIAYVQNSGAGVVSVSVDGGTAVNVTATNATQDFFKTAQPANLTGLDGASHTVTVAGVSGSTYLSGLIAHNGDEAAGVRVWNAGHGGKKAEQFALSGSVYRGLNYIQPDLVVIELGLNDQMTRTAAQYKADLLTIITKVRTECTVPPSILLLAAYKRADVNPPNSWASYVQAMQEIADADALVTFHNLASRFLDSAAAEATFAQYGIVTSDLLHPSAKGHSLIADLLVSNLTPR